MKRLRDSLNEDNAPVPAQQNPSRKPRTPFDIHEVLDFYKTHSQEMRSVVRTMRNTHRDERMFMLGYYVGYSKR